MPAMTDGEVILRIAQQLVQRRSAAWDGALRIPIEEPVPLERIAQAQWRVDAGARGRILLSIPQ